MGESNETRYQGPLVSAIVPSYNHAPYIQECVLSIVNQTYKNIEIIVIDDGSSDNSREILEEMQKRLGFRLEFQANQGLSKTLNKGIRSAQGKYISCSASDDFWELDKVERQVAFLENHPEYSFVCGKIHMVDAQSRIIEGLTIIDPVRDPIESVKFESLLERNCIPAPSVMFTKEIWEKCGGYNENTIVEDFDFCLKVASKSKIVYIDEYFANYRWHGQNITVYTLKMCDAVWEIVQSWKNQMDAGLYKKIAHRRSSSFFSRLARKHKKESFKYLKYCNSYWDSLIVTNYMKGFYKLLFCWKKNDGTVWQ
ncbi:MAG: glycosyltransferase [Candidatus Azobacteroides sp.]|nr:glycosyltransferase [Candidatus Azobacteroides sp.]